MPITIELQDMFSYSFWLVAFAVAVVVLIGVIMMVSFLRKRKPKKPEVQQPVPVQQPIVQPMSGEQIKQTYYALINELENKCRDGKVSNRIAYQELSVILRRFVYEVTGVKVHNYTLEEIKRLNMTSISDVIGECYAPEFSVDKKGAIYDTMNKARMVIKEWH